MCCHRVLVFAHFFIVAHCCLVSSGRAETSSEAPALLALGARIERAFNSGDSETLVRLLDYAVFLRRVGQQIVDDRIRRSILRRQENRHSIWDAQFVADFKSVQGKLKFKKLIYQNGRYRLLFRVQLAQSALDFYEYIVDKNRAGRWQVIDWYQYSSGQNYSQTLSQLLLLISAPKQDVVTELFRFQAVDAKVLEQLLGLFERVQSGQYELAFKTYEALPKQWRLQPTLMSVALNIAAKSAQQNDYQRQLQRLANESKTAQQGLVLLDYYFYHRQFDKALALLEGLESRVGKDPFLSLIKANIYRGQNELGISEQHIKEAIKLDPSINKSYFMLADCYLLMKKYKLALALYQDIQRGLKLRFTAEHFAEFPEFIKMKAVKSWLEQ